MIKVYFACSIRGGRDDQPIYQEIVQLIKDQGTLVLSELFGSAILMDSRHESQSDKQIWAKDISMIKEADAVIAEVTNPSLGVGYEIAKAEEWGKPVLALYRTSADKRLSAMIAGSPNAELVEYQLSNELKTALQQFLKTLQNP